MALVSITSARRVSIGEKLKSIQFTQTGDDFDRVKDDYGFGTRGTIVAMTNSEASKEHQKVRFSDQISNGDLDDDKQLEDERDNIDHVVDENGYTQLEDTMLL